MLYIAIGMCHTGYADCLLAGSGWNICPKHVEGIIIVSCVLLLVLSCLVCVCCYLMCICRTMWALLFFTLDAGLLARSQ